VIGGSSVGTEASINLAMKGHQVTVLEMAKEVDLFRTGAGSDLLDLSRDNGVDRLLGWKLLEIKDKSVVAENVDTGEKKEIAADTVLMAVGLRPRRDEALKFYGCCPATSFTIIGDCAESGDIRDAVWSAFEATRYI
jgi:NADPH-dependent 2,4-dienoyl-CoA reductase/sulfur reductase-like enzyme